VLESLKAGAGDVAGHGDVTGPGFVVPIDVEAAVLLAVPIGAVVEGGFGFNGGASDTQVRACIFSSTH
jgi:hypothetical protein